MHKPRFGVVTAVVAVFTGLAFLSKPLTDLIPKGPENALASENAEFLSQAGHEQIDWRTLTDKTFADARKQDKPIMLVVGTACSPTGRGIDNIVFPSKEVRGILARNFICARVDIMARPEYRNAFLPLSRALLQHEHRLAIPVDCQIWYLDPKGNMFAYSAETSPIQRLDQRALLADLQAVISRYDKLQDHPGTAGADQRADLAAIESNLPAILPDLPGFAVYLGSISEGDRGGFPVKGFQRLWPAAWRFQLLSGHYADYSHSLGPLLTSPDCDVLDGGFYTDAANLGWMDIGYDKLAVVNAGMMHVLATGSVLTSSNYQRMLATRTFDCLLNQFDQNGFIAGGEIGDEQLNGRSKRSSFSPRRMRDMFPDNDDRDWLRNNLGLRVETNPQMIPTVLNPDSLQQNKAVFDRYIDALKKGRADGKFAGMGLLDVGGYTTARMLETARILGDRQRLVNAEGLFERLDDYRSLNDVVHSKATGIEPSAYLGDYLGYADGALQYFLATGNADAFQNGQAVLRRALFLYAGRVKGEYFLSQPVTTALAPQNAAAPEIVDNISESCTAQIIRLCNDYARLLGPKGDDLQKVAGDALTRFAPICPSLGQFAAGYYCAAAKVSDASFAITVGPSALNLALDLASSLPTRLVAPCIAGVRVPGTEPGIYVVRNSSIQGPLTLQKAIAALQPVPF